MRKAAKALAELVAAGHQIVVTHGNGPQVGLLALQAAAGPADGAYPLDILDAESEGMIGYLIEQELAGLLPGRALATLLTLVEVDRSDPAFSRPTKPIGPLYDEATARRMEAERGWCVAPDGVGWRRVVASPMPVKIMEAATIAMLVEHDVTVICGGGGGIPVVERPDGSLQGVEAVIDKDFASDLLARGLGADMLLLLTDVDAVYDAFGTPDARAIRLGTPASLSPARFPAGSMRPKLSAALAFAEATGRPAAIGRLEDAPAIVAGTQGTRIEAR